MSQVDLKAIRRDSGKKEVKAVRNKGLTPGVYYLKGHDPISIAVEPLDLRPVIYTNATRIINLIIEGESEPLECILKAVDFDPVTEDVVHFDLIGIVRGQKMAVEIPLLIKGSAIGVREGGLLSHTLHKAKIYCLPKDIPEALEFDVSLLKVGDSLSLKDSHMDDIEFDLDPNTTVVAVVPPRVTASGELIEAEEDEEAAEDASEVEETATEEASDE